MKTLLVKLEQILSAISFAEAGEHDTARSFMERQDRAAKVHRLGRQRDMVKTPSAHPARRAA